MIDEAALEISLSMNVGSHPISLREQVLILQVCFVIQMASMPSENIEKTCAAANTCFICLRRVHGHGMRAAPSSERAFE